jgi:acyl-CoA synthetase (AMP-forming)/AMP-acid ligase II
VLASAAASRALLAEIIRVTRARAVMGSDAPDGGALNDNAALRSVSYLSWPELSGARPVSPEVHGDMDVAYLQCTSGSIANPKPVTLEHRHVIANARALIARAQFTDRDVLTSWLPLYHDMGLIGGLLAPMVAKSGPVLLPPERFVMEPVSWLRALDRFGGTVTPAPCFGYGLVVRRLRAELASTLDLSSVRVALIGSDPIDPAVLERFALLLAPARFDPRAFMPAYGLAEASLAVTVSAPENGYRIDCVDLEGLHLRGDARLASGDTARRRTFVSCGKPVESTSVEVRGADGREVLSERRIGEIWVRGPGVMREYFGEPEATAVHLADGWLRTGDLGYLADGELYVVGRLKDMIIARGRNYYAEDIERIAESVTGVRRGGAVAFGGDSDGAGSERLFVVAECAVDDPGRRLAIMDEIATRVSEAVGLRLAGVRLVAPREVPRTTSGKKKRAQSREIFIELFSAATALIEKRIHGTVPHAG